ncbi:radical SAM protein [Streptomyces sp. SID486]|uniref:B12-binding domain-containing radical SAM protein n=1 Tax=Streptomyces sp. SID486 TaxID=2690264 RepID=UPI001369D03A|nr:radical SAM protein [Streptomyces sp. SID486]MYX93324.1 radical SAM protein [Streptomyces sp. SID486]
MASRPRTLLVNPPLWNVYAPHLAVPLLTAALRDHGWPVTAFDLGAVHLRWMLTAETVAGLCERYDRADRLGLDPAAVDEARLLLPSVCDGVEAAWAVVHDPAGLHDHDAFARAARTLGNALVCHSAAFDGFHCDLRSNRQHYSERSSASVLAATRDRDRNPYRWAFETLLPPRLADPGLGMVGVSVSADTQLIPAMTVAALVREHRPDLRIVMGGNYITRIAGRWRGRHPFFDLVDDFVLYEGEDAIVALCENLFEGGTRPVPGRSSLTPDGRLDFAPARDVDLATLPAPDFDDYDLDSYLAPGPVLPVLASRSCAWNCAFCSIPFASNRYRHRDATAVVDEMQHLARRYGSTSFMFVDEIMTQRTLREVGAELVRRDAGLHWYGETRFSAGLDDDLAATLHRSGCRRLDLGLESYNQRVLDLMRKGTRIEHIEPGVEALLRAGVPVHLFCITGFPGETDEEARRTAAFVERTLRRSTEEFGLPYSTSVNGPFILDLLSPVGEHPEQFGITVLHPGPDEDLALSVDYIAASGLTGSAAAVLAAEADALPDTGRTAPLQHRGLIGESEEYAFLRCVLDTGVPPGRPTAEPAVFTPAPGDLLRLADGVTWRVSSDTRTVGLYAAGADSVLRLPSRWTGLLSDLDKGVGPGRGDDGRWDDDVLDVLCTLWTFGFLADPQRHATPLPAGDMPGLRVRATPGWRRSVDPDTGRARLTSLVTGREVALNVHAFLLWLDHAGGGQPAAADRDAVADMIRVELLQAYLGDDPVTTEAASGRETGREDA